MSMIRKRIKQVMDERDLSYGQLSELTHIPKSSLQRYVTGSTPKIPIDVIQEIESALNLRKGTLLGWEDTADAEPQTTLPRQTGEHLSLPSIQQKILSNCQQLNETGQKKVLDFSGDLIDSGKYAHIGREPGARIAAYGARETEEDIQPPIEEITT